MKPISNAWSPRIGTALFAFAATLTSVDTASAQSAAPNNTVDTVVFWGFDYSRNDGSNHDFGGGTGFVTSLSNDLGASGLTLSAYLNYAETETAGATTDTLSGWSALSYVWQLPGSYFSLGAGFAAEEDEDLGGFALYGFETTASNAFYAQSYGSFSGIDDAVYALARAGYQGNQHRYGLEVTYLDDDVSSETVRYGVFLGGIRLGKDVSMIASLGYQDESTPGLDDGMYAAIGFSIPLSLR